MKKKELYQNNSCRLPLEHILGKAQVDVVEADFYENRVLVVLVKITPYEVIPLDEHYREIVRHQRFYG